MISIYYSPKYNTITLIKLIEDGRVYMQNMCSGSRDTVELTKTELINSEYEFIGNFKE